MSYYNLPANSYHSLLDPNTNTNPCPNGRNSADASRHDYQTRDYVAVHTLDFSHNKISQTESTSSATVEHYESSLPQSSNNRSTSFDQILGASNFSHQNHDRIASNMSLAYENRDFAAYPSSTMMDEPPQDHTMAQHQRYPSPPAPIADNNSYGSPQIDSSLEMQMPDLPPPTTLEEVAAQLSRSKPLTKPTRQITKNEDGRYVCSWVGCTEEVRAFGRKCEWSKHMDKHDRPYKCPADGCEKLPGFTYSGGLLRHEREVHNLHGGPRKQLRCPHPNCKRHSGKGFSRQENLNEHLRRVHTTLEGEPPNLEETEEDEGERTGAKRKRTGQGDGRENADEMRDNYDHLTRENAELRRQVEIQGGQIAELVRQLEAFQQTVLTPRLAQAPQAMM